MEAALLCIAKTITLNFQACWFTCATAGQAPPGDNRGKKGCHWDNSYYWSSSCSAYYQGLWLIISKLQVYLLKKKKKGQKRAAFLSWHSLFCKFCNLVYHQSYKRRPRMWSHFHRIWNDSTEVTKIPLWCLQNRLQLLKKLSTTRKGGRNSPFLGAHLAKPCKIMSHTSGLPPTYAGN